MSGHTFMKLTSTNFGIGYNMHFRWHHIDPDIQTPAYLIGIRPPGTIFIYRKLLCHYFNALFM